ITNQELEGRRGRRRSQGRLLRWARILSAYFSSQTVTQLLGIAAGLLFVNFMPLREFALYTLSFSVITFFTFLTDLGSSTSLVHFFHRASREGEEFQPYLDAVTSLRRTAFLAGGAAVVLAFPWVATRKGFATWDVALATAGVLLCVGLQIRVSLRLLALRLRSVYNRSYRAEMAGAGLRLLFAAGMVAASRLQAWLGVLASALGSAATAGLAAPEGADRPAVAADLAPYRRRVLRYLLPTLPAAFYFAVQGPLIIWLAATFGSTRNIAEVGALSRLSLVVGLFSGLTGTVFLPRLAGMTDDRHYRRRYLQFGALLAAVAAGLVLLTLAAPRLFLLLLGETYAGLDAELVLVVAGAGVGLLDGYAVSVNLARSWTRWQGAALAVQIAVQALLVAALPLSNTWNVLLFNLLSACVALSLQAATALAGFTRPRWVYWS
ncbi:MAG TPA: oligosaccharide flippase family protein, partial [Thermoanaerobaculia bacterium]